MFYLVFLFILPSTFHHIFLLFLITASSSLLLILTLSKSKIICYTWMYTGLEIQIDFWWEWQVSISESVLLCQPSISSILVCITDLRLFLPDPPYSSGSCPPDLSHSHPLHSNLDPLLLSDKKLCQPNSQQTKELLNMATCLKITIQNTHKLSFCLSIHSIFFIFWIFVGIFMLWG